MTLCGLKHNCVGREGIRVSTESEIGVFKHRSRISYMIPLPVFKAQQVTSKPSVRFRSRRSGHFKPKQRQAVRMADQYEGLDEATLNEMVGHKIYACVCI